MSETRMRAAYFDAVGPAREVLQVGEIAAPTPGPGEVLVRLRASAVNPSDAKLRAGRRGDGTMPFERVVPHSDGAGEIAALGEGVRGRSVGERVYIWNGQWQRPFGTCAQYIALPEWQAPPLPDAVGFQEGACIGIPVMTAQHCVFADGPVEGQTVLVTGGAGRVGRYAVQLAKLGGARVIATVSSAAKAQLAESAGADAVVDYTAGDVAEALKGAAPDGVDRIVEVAFGTNLPASVKVIRPGGTIVAYGSDRVMRPEFPFYEMMFKNTTLHAVLVYLVDGAARRDMIEALHGPLAAGRLDFNIAKVVPLEDTAAAHEAVEAGAVGTVVIEIP